MFIAHSQPSVRECDFLSNDAETGGGVSAGVGSDVTISGCRFLSNEGDYGGGIAFTSEPTYRSSSIVEYSTIARNVATGGGGVFLFSCAVDFAHTTIADNEAVDGGGVWTGYGAFANLDRSIISGSRDAGAIYCDAGSAQLTCCDVYGNQGGDWVGCIANQLGISGNISADPLFCPGPVVEGKYLLDVPSPCGPIQNPVCGQVGAWPVGCSAEAVADNGDAGSRFSLNCAPNPSGGVFRVLLDDGGSVPHDIRCTVLDVNGRVVAELASAPCSSPRYHHFLWNGDTRAGAAAPSGVYFVSVTSGGNRACRSIALIR